MTQPRGSAEAPETPRRKPTPSGTEDSDEALILENARNLEKAQTLESLANAIAERSHLLESMPNYPEAAGRSAAAGDKAAKRLREFWDHGRAELEATTKLRNSLSHQAPSAGRALDTVG